MQDVPIQLKKEDESDERTGLGGFQSRVREGGHAARLRQEGLIQRNPYGQVPAPPRRLGLDDEGDLRVVEVDSDFRLGCRKRQLGDWSLD